MLSSIKTNRLSFEIEVINNKIIICDGHAPSFKSGNCVSYFKITCHVGIFVTKICHHQVFYDWTSRPVVVPIRSKEYHVDRI